MNEQPQRPNDTGRPRHLHFDCSSGVAGDMLMASLLDLGADQEQIHRTLLAVGVPEPCLTVSTVRRGGMRGLHVQIPDADPDDVPNQVTYVDLRARLQTADLPEHVRQRALSVLSRLAKAEAHVHGIGEALVHFHELGAIDTIADIVGVCTAIDLLNADQFSASPVAVGAGTIRIAHGQVPVPAPATLELLKGVPIYPGVPQQHNRPSGPQTPSNHMEPNRERDGIRNDPSGLELATPTGAALLTEFCNQFGTMPAMEVASIGYGAGTRELPSRPNLLRAVLGHLDDQPTRPRRLASGVSNASQTHAGSASNSKAEPTPLAPDFMNHLVEVHANLDDLAPELVANLTTRLFEVGCLDVWTLSAQMKKGRPGQVVCALLRPGDLDAVTSLFWSESTTLGLRWHQVERARLERRTGTVETPWGTVAIMVAINQDRFVRATPEFDSCRQAARQAHVAVQAVYRAALAACEAVKDC